MATEDERAAATELLAEMIAAGAPIAFEADGALITGDGARLVAELRARLASAEADVADARKTAAALREDLAEARAALGRAVAEVDGLRAGPVQLAPTNTVAVIEGLLGAKHGTYRVNGGRHARVFIDCEGARYTDGAQVVTVTAFDASGHADGSIRISRASGAVSTLRGFVDLEHFGSLEGPIA